MTHTTHAHIRAPQVARWVGERLASPYRFKYLPTDADSPLPEAYQADGLEARCVCVCV